MIDYETIRSKFEKRADVVKFMETHNVQYSQCGGYHYDGDRDTPSYYLNGALWMFKELYCDIGCKHNWVGKSENQYCSKCGIGDE